MDTIIMASTVVTRASSQSGITTGLIGFSGVDTLFNSSSFITKSIILTSAIESGENQ